tara:strand:- start:1342 stop:1722 length:381 start_codon:yes stop_codon:yes gene_type:complete
MLLAAFEPGQEMAIANFFLAIFLLFTIALPLLLITRGDKTEANRDFLTATLNPWSHIGKEIELTPVVVSGITPTTEAQPKLEIISDNSYVPISESDQVISIERKDSDELGETPVQEPGNLEEVLAA